MTQKVPLRDSHTNGLQAILEDIFAAEVDLDRHIDYELDETLNFVEVKFDAEIDGQSFQMNEGNTAFISKGTIHGWQNVGVGICRL